MSSDTSHFIIAVPRQGKAGPHTLEQLQKAVGSLGSASTFKCPDLKVGTLDALMQLSDELARDDAVAEQVSKKIFRAYGDVIRAKPAAPDSSSSSFSSSSSSSRSSSKASPLKGGISVLKLDGKTTAEVVESFKWNKTRFPRKAPIKSLSNTMMDDVSKAEENLRCQLAAFNEVKTLAEQIDRKENGTLLVKPLAQYIKKKSDIIESDHLRTLIVVVPKSNQKKFLESYELMEAEWQEEERKLAAATKQREQADKRLKQEREATAKRSSNSNSNIFFEHKEESKDKDADSSQLSASSSSSAPPPASPEASSSRTGDDGGLSEERLKRLPKCHNVVPKSAKLLADSSDFVLYRLVVLRKGVGHVEKLCRQRQFTVRPFKFDPQEEKAALAKKEELNRKRISLWNYLVRMCKTIFRDVYTEWLHIKAMRMFVEVVLRFGLPVDFVSFVVRVNKGCEAKIRKQLNSLYVELAGGSASLMDGLGGSTADKALDMGGFMGQVEEMFPYVSLSMQANLDL